MNQDEIAAGLAPTDGYRYVERVGGELFVAGQVPVDRSGEIIGEGSPAEQATQCLRNLRTVIETNSFELSDVRHLRVHVVGSHSDLIDAWQAVKTWFSGAVPPATLLGSPVLGHRGQLVEIEAVVRHRDG